MHKARKEREGMKLALERATSTLASVRQQYFEQQEELQEDKIALNVLVDEGQSTAAGLRHDLKKAEASTAYLNTQLSALDSGSRDKDAASNDLQMKLATATATEATSMTKWDAERQQLRDEIARAQREKRRAQLDRDETNETIRRIQAVNDHKSQRVQERADCRRTRPVREGGDDTSPRSAQ